MTPDACGPVPARLAPPGGGPQVLAPTSPVKLAQRVLATSRLVTELLPEDVNTVQALDVLLELFVAEEAAAYPSIGQLAPPSTLSSHVVRRWVAALEAKGLVERRGELIALADRGHAVVLEFLTELYAAQRRLD